MLSRDELIQQIIEKEALLREVKGRKLVKDLYEFNKQVLQVEQTGPLSEFHKQMCDFVMADGKKRKLILVPRQHLKSTIVTVGYSLLRIAQNPKVRILIANATYDMACTFLTQIKKHLQNNQKFKDLYGNLTEGADKWSENMISVPSEEGFAKKEATVTAYGMGGNLVSQHYDLIILDDIVNRDAINTPEQIQKTILFYKDALDLIEPEGLILVLGTRWHQNDLYGWILDKNNPQQVYQGYDLFFRTAFSGSLDTGDHFQALFPQKFTQTYLQELKRDKGPYEFAAQYENNCVPVETALFKPDWFHIVGEDELKTRNINYFTMVDPAIGQKTDSDKTAIVTIGVDEYNNWWVRSIVWGHLTPNEIIKAIFDNWDLFHPKRIGVELTAFQKSLQYALHDEMRRRNIFLPIIELKASASKNERIEGMVPRYANGTVYHLQNCPYRDMLEEELVWYPRGKHDDIIDSLAYGLQIAVPSRKMETKWHKRSGDEDRERRQYLY